MHTYTVPQPDADMLVSAAILDDLNGDGHAEWVVGTPGLNTLVIGSGQVKVLSGIDHSTLHTIDGALAGGRFGTLAPNVGDLNSDGFCDFAVGASGEQTVYLFSGANFSLLWSHTEPGTTNFGKVLAHAGDVNGDGQQDIVVGGNGRIHVLRGDTGAEIFNFAGGGGLGASVCAAGDVDGDGFDDIIAGQPTVMLAGEANAGQVTVIGGPTGSTIDTLRATNFPFFDYRGMQFGFAVTALEDYDGDGVPEFAVGAPWYGWIHYIADNWVGVFSGATRALLWSRSGPSDGMFGNALASGGDLDLDGHLDLLVGNPMHRTLYAFSPSRDLQLFQWSSTSYQTASSVVGGGDVNGDGFPDVIACSEVDVYAPTGTAGEAVLLTNGCPPDAVYNYCTAVANSTGQRARMHWQNTTSVTNNNFRLSATKCPLNKPGLFFYGTLAIELPVGEGHLCVAGSTSRLPVVNTGSTGTPSHTLDFTNPPSASGQISPGDTRYFSFWFRDPSGGPSGFNFTDGLRATFCP